MSLLSVEMSKHLCFGTTLVFSTKVAVCRAREEMAAVVTVPAGYHVLRIFQGQRVYLFLREQFPPRIYLGHEAMLHGGMVNLKEKNQTWHVKAQ